MLKNTLVICIGLIILLSVVCLLDKPNITDESKVYNFVEKKDYDLSSLIKFGVNVLHMDGHQVEYVWIALKDFPEIKSLEVYKKDDSLIILIEDNKGKPKKDRIFEATDVEGIYDVLDNVKVYRNGKRYYFIRSAKGFE